jgi:protein-tyrosine phosphatase
MGVLPGDGPVRHVLVVCTANRARSPVAAQLLAAAASDRHAAHVLVHSAGIAADPGLDLLPSMRKVMLRRGMKVPEHRARRLDAREALGSQLVITMTEQQRRAVTRSGPSLVPRCYTLLELVRLVRSPHWCDEWNGRDDVVERLNRTRALAAPPDRPEDVPDPSQGGTRLARSVLDQIDRAVRSIADPLFGAPDR